MCFIMQVVVIAIDWNTQLDQSLSYLIQTVPERYKKKSAIVCKSYPGISNFYNDFNVNFWLQL